MTSRSRRIAIIAAIVACVGLADSSYLTVKHLQGAYIRCGNECSAVLGSRYADGTVVHLIGSDRKRAVVEFATPDGTRILFTSWVSTSPPPAEVGGHVGVRYNPDNPQDAVIDQYWQTWFLPTLFGIFGAPVLLVGLLVW